MLGLALGSMGIISTWYMTATFQQPVSELDGDPRDTRLVLPLWEGNAMSEPDARPGWHTLNVVAPQLHMLLVIYMLPRPSEMSTSRCLKSPRTSPTWHLDHQKLSSCMRQDMWRPAAMDHKAHARNGGEEASGFVPEC
jgi:hypothetical protein